MFLFAASFDVCTHTYMESRCQSNATRQIEFTTNKRPKHGRIEIIQVIPTPQIAILHLLPINCDFSLLVVQSSLLLLALTWCVQSSFAECALMPLCIPFSFICISGYLRFLLLVGASSCFHDRPSSIALYFAFLSLHLQCLNRPSKTKRA